MTIKSKVVVMASRRSRITDHLFARGKMLKLTVIVRSRDSHTGKPIADLFVSLYGKNGVSGATILQGVRGYGKHGMARAHVLGLSINLPLVVMTIGETEKIESILSKVKKIVGSNRIITLEEVSVL